MQTRLAAWVALSLLGAATAQAQTQEPTPSNLGVEFSGSGFLTLGVGKMLGGSHRDVADNHCPCFIADYANAAVYDGRNAWQSGPDTKLGLQGSVSSLDRRLSATVQVVSRGADGARTDLEWLYGSYRVNDAVTLQAGRKRLPMFYYSETQDVGVTLPWTHLPPQLYGWEMVNYNGVNVLTQTQLGGWSLSSNLLAGNSSLNDAGYDRIYNGRRSRTDAKWDNIVGGDLTFQKDWLETRLVYLQSKTRTRNVSGTWDAAINDYDPATAQDDYGPHGRQRIMGAAFNVDYRDWLWRSELIRIDHPGGTFRDHAYIVAAGKRFGKWQLLLTESSYWATADVKNGGDPDGQEAHVTRSVTLRYDLTPSSALKIQYDHQRDKSGPNWGIALDSNSPTGVGPPYGDSRLLTITYDLVF